MERVPDISVVDRLDERHVEQLVELYAQEWWTDTRVIADVRLMLEHTSIVVALVDAAHDLVAIARVVTDRVYNATLLDVIVRDDMRGRGLGDCLMREVLEHRELTRLASMQLRCRADKVAFYERHGFAVRTTVDHPVHGPAATMSRAWRRD